MSAAPTSNARRRNPFGEAAERTMIGTSGAARCAPSMICSDRSSSRPWQATTMMSALCAWSARTVSSTPSVIPRSWKLGVVGQAALHVEGIEPFDGNDCANRGIHGPATSPVAAGG